jgi:hypothetical protein
MGERALPFGSLRQEVAMKRLGHGLCLCCLLTSCIAAAEPATRKTPPPEMVAHFNDGSMVRRVCLADSVELQTRYGKVTVPVAEIRRVEFASRVSEETSRRIDRALEQLASRSFAQREAATKELQGLGFRGYHTVKKLADAPDKEVARRVREVLAHIEQNLTPEQLRQRTQDTIHTGDSVLTGQIVGMQLKGRTTTFGDMRLAVAEMRELHLETQSAAVSLDGLTLGTAERRWIDSGLTVDAGGELRVAATGQMDLMAKDQPGQHLCTPDGHASFAKTPEGMMPGMLIGRIGENGQPFVIGSQCQMKALNGSGKLFLSVIPAAPGQLQGSYQVRLKTGGDGLVPVVAPATSTSAYTPEAVPVPTPVLPPPAPAPIPLVAPAGSR